DRIHELAIAEALQDEPPEQAPLLAPFEHETEDRRRQIDYHEDAVVNGDELEIGIAEFRPMLRPGDPLANELPDEQKIGERRQRRERDLEEPHLRQRDHAERAMARIESEGAVLPQTLQRAIGPAEALPGEIAE